MTEFERAAPDAERSQSGHFRIHERMHAESVAAKAAFSMRAPGANFINGIDQTSLSVFQQNWWLEIARGAERYHEVQVFRGGTLVGSLPYVMRSTKLGLSWGASPHWCHLGGPVLSPSLSVAEKSEVLDLLIANLPARRSIGFTCGPHSEDARLITRAFVAAGFTHTIEETYSQSPDQASVLSRLNKKHRYHIEAARRALEIVELDDKEFITFYATNLAAAALEGHLPLDLAQALIAKGRVRNPPQVKVFAAKRTSAGAPLDAAVACAWDSHRYYYWMSTRRRHLKDGRYEKPHPDAIKLLIVNAMEHAKSLNLIFDVCGFNALGAQKLYKELLRIPNEEPRDVFERLTLITRLYRTYHRRLTKFAAVRYAKRLITRVATAGRR